MDDTINLRTISDDGESISIGVVGGGNGCANGFTRIQVQVHECKRLGVEVWRCVIQQQF